MNSGSGMMRIGVTIPLISLIAIFLFLNLFLGVWILALPLTAAAALLIFFVGANRVKSSVGSPAEARANSVNLFGLPDLPRFYGFLHIFCWFIPPILFLVVWQIFGGAWMNAQFTTMSLGILGDPVVDYDGMAAASRSLFANYFLGSALAPDLVGYAPEFSAQFADKFLARRWFWLALVTACVAFWRVAPNDYSTREGKILALGGLVIATALLALFGFVIMACGVAIIGAWLAYSTLVRGRPLNGAIGQLLMLAGFVAIILALYHNAHAFGFGLAFSTLLLAASLLALWVLGERLSLRRAPSLIVLTAIAVLIAAIAFAVFDMMGWVQFNVATDFGRPSPSVIKIEGDRVMRLVAEARQGADPLSAELLKSARASEAHGLAAVRWLSLNNLSQNIVFFGTLISLVIGALLSVVIIRPHRRARQMHEATAQVLLVTASTIAILVTIGLVLALLGSAELFFAKVPAQEFLNELKWNKGGIHASDDGPRKSTLGAIPVFYGTLMVSFVALAFAVPIGLFSAVYMSEYASNTVRGIFKPILEILAGVPTIVYGVFALLIVGPAVREAWGVIGEPLTGYEMSGRSALVAGAVMGIMLIPFISSLSDDALKAVPRPLRDGSLALGANRSETIMKVLLPAALPGIMGGILLATSRAIGETMIVVLAAGRFAQIKLNPLEPMTTVTVQIVEFLTGDISLDSPEALSAFGLGLVLFLATLVLNMIAIVIVRRYRLKYS